MLALVGEIDTGWPIVFILAGWPVNVFEVNAGPDKIGPELAVVDPTMDAVVGFELMPSIDGWDTVLVLVMVKLGSARAFADDFDSNCIKKLF